MATEKPLVYGPRSIRAWQDEGLKTQARQMVRPQPEGENWIPWQDEGLWFWLIPLGPEKGFDSRPIRQPCAVGDLCWIREALVSSNDQYFVGENAEPCHIALYAADRVVAINQGRPMTWRWKRSKLPAIFMPRRAARYHARIIGVRPERLQEITVEDAVAEGTLVGLDYATLMDWHDGKSRDLYRECWDDLYQKPADRWEANPMVWKYELEDADASTEA